MLAITPAARPRTILALLPMTGSFVSDQVTYAAAGLAEQTVVGEELSRGFHRPLDVTCYRQPPVYGEQKIRALPRARRYRGCSCQGPEQRPLYYIS